MGFAARKQALTVYLPSLEGYDDLLGTLGPHSTGVGCLYLKRLADVDSAVLSELVRRSAEDTRGGG